MEYVLGYIIISLLVMLLCREIVCWYFKINESLSELSEVNRNITKLNNNLMQLLAKDQNAALNENSSTLEANGLSNIDNIQQEIQMGSCPQCQFSLPKSSERCPNCDALFVGKHAKWKPI